MPASDNFRSRRAGDPAPVPERIDEAGLEYALDHLTDAGLATLLEWARREAPELLRVLLISYLEGRYPNGATEDLASACPGRDSDSVNTPSAESIRRLEREHITRVVAESETLAEAAARLGIHNTTLWRRLKRYKTPPP